MPKITPANCKHNFCGWNVIPPGENSQECIGCDGNLDPEWKPVRNQQLMSDKEKLALLDLAAFITWSVQNNREYMWCLGNVGHDLSGMVRQEEGFLPRSTGYTKQI